MLHLSLKPSRQLTLLVLVLHLAALGSVLSVAMPVSFKVLLLGAIVLSGAMYWAGQAAQRLPWSIIAFSMTPEGSVTLQQRNHDEVEGFLLDGSFVAPWLTIVRYKRGDSRLPRTLLILPDMLSPELFRQLRVSLKWRRPQAQPLF